MNQEELTQLIERIGIAIFNIFKKEGIKLDTEDLDEIENRVLNLLAKHGVAK